MRSVKGLAYGIMAVVFLLALSGCKKKESVPAQPVQAVGPSAAEVARIRDGLTRGMRPMDISKLSKTQIGKRCVVVARSVPIPPPPPPLGMVHIMGPTTLYVAELSDISPEALKIRAAYPTSGNYKHIEIARADIESIHLSD
jgi:hypothetical protein